MAVFRDAEELHRYVGGAMRAAGRHPEVGPRLAAAQLTVALHYSEPEATATLHLRPPLLVTDCWADPEADVTLWMPGDVADRYWRGDYNLAVGVARGKVRAEGAVDALLRLLPLTRPVFPLYRLMVAERDVLTAG